MQLRRRDFSRLIIGGVTVAGAISPAFAAKTIEVDMSAGEAKFDPANITIQAGDTVKWTNSGIVSHSVTFDPSMAQDASHVVLPAGAQPFDSGEMMQDQTFSHQFTIKGTYKYICKYHEPMGMVGTVVVT